VLFVSFVVRTMGWEKDANHKICFTEKIHFYECPRSFTGPIAW